MTDHAGHKAMMGRKASKRLIIGTIFIAATVGFAPHVRAQDDPERASVTERQRESYDAAGVRVGGFLVFPKLSVEEQYNDNIFSQNLATKSDFITVIEPTVSVESDWGVHALNLYGGASLGRYVKFGRESYDDLSLGADGLLEFTRDSSLIGAIAMAWKHEARGSPDDVQGDEPTEYALATARVLFSQGFNRVTVSLEGIGERYDYNDVARRFGTINNDDRDRHEANLRAQLRYELSPDYSALISASANARAYDEAVDDTGFDRDSRGWELTAGMSMDLTGITAAEMRLGYMQQIYDDPQLVKLAGLAARATVTWNVTRLTTVTAALSRSIEETTLAGASGFLATGARLGVDHELLRNLLLNIGLSLTFNDYEGIDRNDIIYSATANAKYLLNRNFHAAIKYNYKNRISRFPGSTADYARNLFMIYLAVQL